MSNYDGYIHPLIDNYFRQYYLHAKLDPLELRFRQIKIKLFGNRWIIAKRSIAKEKQLTKFINKLINPPAHVYSTLLQFLDVSHLTTKQKPAICLSGPFVVDFDIQGHTLYFRNELESLKQDILDVTDLLHDWYSVSEFAYVFSGHRGFHLYVLDFPQRCLRSSYWGYQRERYESQQRHRITWQLRLVGLAFDYPISTDTRRIIRIPGTLHGATGLRCLKLGSEKELWKFELEDAQIQLSSEIFEVNITVEVVRNLPQFEWESREYSGKNGDKLKVPIALAALLTLQQDVVIRKNNLFAELPEKNELKELRARDVIRQQ
ncbi:MAG: hypothetical protein ACXADY_16895 [Candidatus Hodarchaeales archaeon]|jgi:DNA primase catalytic subunit